MKTEHKTKVEQKVASVKENYMALSAGNSDLAELLRIIHFPGYTTPAESIFTVGIAESLATISAGLTQLHQTLIEGAKAVIAVEAQHA
ncbi:MAG TPA: hypothetical protein VG367_18585 [Mucilaginibacter sp.]|jgi:hypothetical protein|nr:hypothetical protein [Mucilaginibacter sp.]